MNLVASSMFGSCSLLDLTKILKFVFITTLAKSTDCCLSSEIPNQHPLMSYSPWEQ